MRIRRISHALLPALLLLGSASAAAPQEVPAVFLHGFQSSGSKWQLTADRVQQELALTAFRPDLNWRASYESQTNDVQTAFGGFSGATIAIGHSNGGVVAFLPFWTVFETIYRMKVRTLLGCPHCGFLGPTVAGSRPSHTAF